MVDPSQIVSIKVTSTFRSAFADPFNWMMIFATLMLLAASGIALISNPGALLRTFILISLFLLASWFLQHYVKAILNREIEILPNGVRYREGSRLLFFEWDKIQKVNIERSKKQITFWVNNKPQRIHEFGLPKSQLDAERKVLMAHLSSRSIPFVLY